MRHMSRLIATIAMLLSAAPLAAQNDSLPGPVTASDTVRLHENRTMLVQGVLLRRDSTGLVVVDRQTRDTVHIPLFQITRAEVQRGSLRRGWKASALGLAAGAAIGAALVAVAAMAPGQHDEGIGLFVAGLAAAATTGAGVIVGSLASLSSTETWYPFDPKSVPPL